MEAQESPIQAFQKKLAMDQEIGRRPISRRPISRRRDDGYDAMIDIMADMRHHGVVISPVVQNLVLQLYEAAKTAEERSEHLVSKHAHLQAEHTQLEIEFNRYCNDADEAWQTKPKQLLYEDMRRSVDSANGSNQMTRDAMKNIFSEYLTLITEFSALRMEVAALRKENEALRAEKTTKEEN
ncbi:hypothetical protein F5Y04DRAFT_279768 [Hypomontagnella monticulosa]|nr:hypothetical protein F5Y04DRAFT_279768 [Hypomontagnella monticulosa]